MSDSRRTVAIFVSAKNGLVEIETPDRIILLSPWASLGAALWLVRSAIIAALWRAITTSGRGQ